MAKTTNKQNVVETIASSYFKSASDQAVRQTNKLAELVCAIATDDSTFSAMLRDDCIDIVKGDYNGDENEWRRAAINGVYPAYQTLLNTKEKLANSKSKTDAVSLRSTSERIKAINTAFSRVVKAMAGLMHETSGYLEESQLKMRSDKSLQFHKVTLDDKGEPVVAEDDDIMHASQLTEIVKKEGSERAVSTDAATIEQLWHAMHSKMNPEGRAIKFDEWHSDIKEVMLEMREFWNHYISAEDAVKAQEEIDNNNVNDAQANVSANAS